VEKIVLGKLDEEREKVRESIAIPESLKEPVAITKQVVSKPKKSRARKLTNTLLLADDSTQPVQEIEKKEEPDIQIPVVNEVPGNEVKEVPLEVNTEIQKEEVPVNKEPIVTTVKKPRVKKLKLKLEE
jgi:hypothetical protein